MIPIFPGDSTPQWGTGRRLLHVAPFLRQIKW